MTDSTGRDTSDNLGDLIGLSFQGCQFRLADGSPEDKNREMADEVKALVELLRTACPSRVLICDETVMAAAYLRHRFRRGRTNVMTLNLPRATAVVGMSLERFAGECSVDLSKRNARKVKKVAEVMIQVIKSLLVKLPYMKENEVKKMKADDVLSYLRDVFEFKTLLIKDDTAMFERTDESVSAVQVGQTEEFKKGQDDLDDEELQDVDCYIRSKEEVEAIKGYFEKVHSRK